MATNAVFRTNRMVKDEPYKIIDVNDPRYTESWRKTANVGNTQNFQSVEKYLASKDREASAFKKKAFKNMNKKKRSK